MDHPESAVSLQADRVDFDLRVRLEFRDTQLSSDGGLLVMRELDHALGLSALASAALFEQARPTLDDVKILADWNGKPDNGKTRIANRQGERRELRDALSKRKSIDAKDSRLSRYRACEAI